MNPSLEDFRQTYDRLKLDILPLGFICQGSLILRSTACGRPGCHCQADPPQLHGPYHQLTRKLYGRTVTSRLTPAHAAAYRDYIANRQALQIILDSMYDLSRRAFELQLGFPP